jgi:NADPH-dependent curcumin reductase CurA
VYFDNVGGDILDDVLTRINMKARIVICGAISQYNNTTPVKGPSNYLSLLVNRAKMEGIVVFDNVKNYGKAASEMAGWIAEGKLIAKEHVVEGIETFPETLLMLFNGENFGKLVLKVGNDE